MSLRTDDPILRSLLDGMVSEVSDIEASLRAHFDAALKRAEDANKALDRDAQAARRALQVAQDEIAALNRRLEHANAGVAEGKQAKARVEALQQELAAAGERHRQAMEAMEARHREHMAAMMERQKEHLQATEALPRAFEDALARLSAQVTAAIRERPAPAVVTPPTYEMQVVARDGNNRATKIRLRPAKE